MIKSFTTTILLILCGLFVKGQDIHFSQFYMSPLNLNPALTGVIGCDMRLSANYRNQWSSILRSNAFTTYSAGFDTRLDVGRYDYVGLGGSFWADKVGEASFSTIQGAISAAYLKRLGGRRSNESYLVAGAQIGVTQRSIDVTKLLYGDQWDGDGVNLPTSETPFDGNFVFADINAGLLWFAALDRKGTNKVYAGLAFSHLNRANLSFTRETFEALYGKFTLHAGGDFMFNERIGLVPGFVLFQQGPSFEANLGTSVKFAFGGRGSRQAFHFGGWIRIAGHYENSFLSDAAIISTRFDYNDFSLGLSYDVNVSSLAAATNSNGAFELALNYIICTGKSRKMGCPTF